MEFKSNDVRIWEFHIVLSLEVWSMVHTNYKEVQSDHEREYHPKKKT